MIQEFFATHNFNIIQFLLVVLGYLAPIPLSVWALHLWHHYRQERFISGMKWTVLEVLVPREVIKSPAAMELIFSNALYHKSNKGFWEQYIQGAPWFWFSLEIASIEGRVHFFIRTPSRLRDLVETQIYAQYPQAKVIEVDDYTLHVPQYHEDGTFYMWGCEFTKEKPDFLPVKTYRDIDELKSGTKEEYKIDPITPVIEFLGSLPKGQQCWIQIIVRQSIKQYHSHETGGHVDFYTAAEEYIYEVILKKFTRSQKWESNPGEFGLDVRTPDPVKHKVEAVRENATKIHFDCGIRVITLADKKNNSLGEFDSLRRGARLLFRQYAQPTINEFKRINSTQSDQPWADPTGLAMAKRKRRMLNNFRMRVFFHPPLQYSVDFPGILQIFYPSDRPQIFVLSAEELATIYHFPGMVSETPSFKRIESKIAKPPANLPT
jgi:hypothetical protein